MQVFVEASPLFIKYDQFVSNMKRETNGLVEDISILFYFTKISKEFFFFFQSKVGSAPLRKKSSMSTVSRVTAEDSMLYLASEPSMKLSRETSSKKHGGVVRSEASVAPVVTYGELRLHSFSS